jgi:hypothetical protein
MQFQKTSDFCCGNLFPECKTTAAAGNLNLAFSSTAIVNDQLIVTGEVAVLNSE